MDCTVVGDIFFDVIISNNPASLELVRGGTSYLNPIRFEFGGAGNIAVGLSRLGGEVQFIGKAGNDLLGGLYRDNLIEEKVVPNIEFDESHPTGVAVVFVDDCAERSFIVSRAANDFLLPTEITNFKDVIINSKYLFISGYSLVKNPQREAILTALTIAKANGTKVFFDPSSYNLIRNQKSFFQKIIHLSDVVSLNLDESKALTDCDNVSNIIKHLSKAVPLTVLKMGSNGCMIIKQNETFSCPGYSVSNVDSTGAGDVFDSALLFGLVNDFPMQTTAKLANWFASHVVQKMGARAFPLTADIKSFLSTLL